MTVITHSNVDSYQARSGCHCHPTYETVDGVNDRKRHESLEDAIKHIAELELSRKDDFNIDDWDHVFIRLGNQQEGEDELVEEPSSYYREQIEEAKKSL